MNTFQSVILILTFLIMCAILVMLIIAANKIASLFKPIPKCKYKLPTDVDLRPYIFPIIANSLDVVVELKNTSGESAGKLTIDSNKGTLTEASGLKDEVYTFIHNQDEFTFNFSKLLAVQGLKGVKSSLADDETPMTGLGSMFDATCEY